MVKWLQQRLAAGGISARIEPVRIEPARIDPERALIGRSPVGRLIALTSSHLGRSVVRQAHICRYLVRSMSDARREGHVGLVAAESAIEPWAVRAADLFDVPLVRVNLVTAGDAARAANSISHGTCRSRITECWVHCADGVSRDDVVIQMADQVDCVFLRAKGTIEQALRKRLAARTDASTRIAIDDPPTDKRTCRAVKDLMEHGALGWYCAEGYCPAGYRPAKYCPAVRPLSRRSHHTPSIRWSSDDWARRGGDSVDDGWLVHCTRTCDGPWPGQTLRQHRDALLLGDRSLALADKHSPLGSLRRILQTRRLIASALASDRTHPVVCFSAVALQTLLKRRRYRPHLHRWDYEPYGIAIRKSVASACGFEPVIYGSPADRRRLKPSQAYRFQAVGRTYDWTAECEWRSPRDVDLDRLHPSDVRVFVRTRTEAMELPDRFPVTPVGHLLD